MVKIDMKMPKSCKECKLVYTHRYDEHRHLCCLIAPSTRDSEITGYTKNRHHRCPLQEVKE